MSNGQIVIFQRIVPHYRKSVFRILHERFGAIVCHSRERNHSSLKDSGPSLGFPNEYLRRVYVGSKETTCVQELLPILLKYRPKLVVSEFSATYLTFWFLLLLRPLFKYKLAIWSHGIHNHEMAAPFTNMGGRLRLFAFRKTDGLFIYSKERRDLLVPYLCRPVPMFLVSNTLDTCSLNNVYDNLFKEGRVRVRERLGMSNGFHLFYIGRLIAPKRIDVLLKSFELLLEMGADVHLHIIGNGPEHTHVNKIHKYHPDRLHDHGQIEAQERKGELMFAADLNVHPGNVGLSIVDGLCFGKPLVTCKGQEHGPEITYLHDGVNGLMVDPQPVAIAQAIFSLIENPQRVEKMQKEARRTCLEECSLDVMIKGFEKGFRELQ